MAKVRWPPSLSAAVWTGAHGEDGALVPFRLRHLPSRCERCSLYRSAAKLQALPSRPPFASRDLPWHPGSMAREMTEEAWVQLATRIPKSLHRQLKLHCVHTDTSLMEVVVAALKKKLGRQGRRGRRSRDEGTS